MDFAAWNPYSVALLTFVTVQRLAELVLDGPGDHYRFATHYTSDVFVTDRPWPVRIDLPRLIAKRARAMRTKPSEE